MNDLVNDPWAKMRAATPARIGLGRAGAGLPTANNLDFQFAHARARDAVHRAVDWDRLEAEIAPLETIRVRSAAPDRPTYLRRPDLGRRLAPGDWPALVRSEKPDVAVVVADGLTADAIAAQAAPVVHASCAALAGLSIGPIVLAEQGRVAIGDEIGERLGARLVVLLVGERPGLTVADSLGAYITYGPRVGRKDSERNCISNIHGNGGLSHDEAAAKIAWLVRQALKLELTGTGLKEDAGALPGRSDTPLLDL